MNKQEVIQQAIDRVVGQEIKPGTIVADRDDDRTWELVDYEDTIAVLRIGDEVRRVPRSAIFDVKKVINVANHLINVGFWEEGMESMILTIQ